MNTIAVDAMGGDSAPEEIVKGAIKAKNLGIDVIQRFPSFIIQK